VIDQHGGHRRTNQVLVANVEDIVRDCATVLANLAGRPFELLDVGAGNEDFSAEAG
jgi:hypothetical protein